MFTIYLPICLYCITRIHRPFCFTLPAYLFVLRASLPCPIPLSPRLPSPRGVACRLGRVLGAVVAGHAAEDLAGAGRGGQQGERGRRGPAVPPPVRQEEPHPAAEQRCRLPSQQDQGWRFSSLSPSSLLFEIDGRSYLLVLLVSPSSVFVLRERGFVAPRELWLHVAGRISLGFYVFEAVAFLGRGCPAYNCSSVHLLLVFISIVQFILPNLPYDS